MHIKKYMSTLLVLVFIIFACTNNNTNNNEPLEINLNFYKYEIKSFNSEDLIFNVLDIDDDILYYNYRPKGYFMGEHNNLGYVYAINESGDISEILKIPEEDTLISFSRVADYYYLVTAKIDSTKNYPNIYQIKKQKVYGDNIPETILSAQTLNSLALPRLTNVNGEIYALVETYEDVSQNLLKKHNYLYNVTKEKIVIDVSEEFFESENYDISDSLNWSYTPVFDPQNSLVMFGTFKHLYDAVELDNVEFVSDMYTFDGETTNISSFKNKLPRFFIEIGNHILFTTTKENEHAKLAVVSKDNLENVAYYDKMFQSILKVGNYADGALVVFNDTHGQNSLKFVRIDKKLNYNLVDVENKDITNLYMSIMPNGVGFAEESYSEDKIIFEVYNGN